MFQHIGRRLAILNAAIVTLVLLMTGGVTYLALNQSLNREIDSQLRDRVHQFEERTGSLSTVTSTSTTSSDDDEHEDQEIAASGDTIVFMINSAGVPTANSRGIEIEGLPIESGIRRALAGDTDIRSVEVDNLGAMRVLTVPMREDGQVVGAIQAMRSLREHDQELALVRWMTVIGTVLGIVLSVPAGLFLAGRAMRPIGDSFRRQQTFVADASHELRTPLTLIRANAELVLMDDSKSVADVEPEINSILDEVAHTDRLVDDLLTLARADAGRLDLRFEITDLHAFVRDVVEQIRPLARQRSVNVTVEGNELVRAAIDPDRFRQALRILLDNALRYVESGGSVTVSVLHQHQEAVVIIRDDGPGIAPADLAHVFDRFYRSDASRTRASGAAGLGLPIAKSLIDAHGGKLEIESAHGSGTRVIIRLPIRG